MFKRKSIDIMFGTEIRRNNAKIGGNNAKKSVINAFSSSPKSTIKCIVQCNMRTLYLINECFTSFEFLGFVMLHKWSKDRTSLAYWTQNWPLSLKAKRAKIERVQNNQYVFFRALPETSEKMRLQSWYEQRLVLVWRQCVLNIAAKSKLINHYQTHF